MKKIVYLRVGKDGLKIKVDASKKHKSEPLRESTRARSKSIPTVYMMLELNIPDEAFRPPSITASITVPIEKLGTRIEVVDPLRRL